MPRGFAASIASFKKLEQHQNSIWNVNEMIQLNCSQQWQSQTTSGDGALKSTTGGLPEAACGGHSLQAAPLSPTIQF